MSVPVNDEFWQAGIFFTDTHEPCTRSEALATMVLVASKEGWSGPVLVEDGDGDGIFLITVPPRWAEALNDPDDGVVDVVFAWTPDAKELGARNVQIMIEAA
jgi:hypothetical protein